MSGWLRTGSEDRCYEGVLSTMGKVDGSERSGFERYALLNHIPLGVCILRQDFTVSYWNACLSAWTGVKASEIIDHDVTEFFPEIGDAECRIRIEAVLEGGAATAFSPDLYPRFFADLRGRRGERVQQTTVTAIPAGDRSEAAGGEYLAMFTVEDVTARAQLLRGSGEVHGAESERSGHHRLLEEENARLSAQVRDMHRLESLEVLSSSIAHDINNLLSVIVGNADIVAAEVRSRQLLSHCASEIQKGALGASQLVAQMLAYSGGGTFVMDVVNLSELVDENRNLLQCTVPPRVDVVFAVSRDLPDVAGNRSQLQQVVVNLMANAAEVIGDNAGTIRISTGVVSVDETYLDSLHEHDYLDPGDYVYLEVKDSGPGLEDGVLDRIHDTAFSTRHPGRALGLAAMVKIVGAHHGGVRVLSIPGEGTAFRVHFPLLPGEVDLYEPREARGLLDDSPSVTTILLVDDEEMVRALGEIILEQHGYAVITASDGDEAVTAYETHADSLSLVLLDMSMPKRSGYEVARAMRAIRADTPIILCSGYSGVDARNRFPDLRVDGFLRKPYRMNELLDAVQQMLSRFGE